MKYNENRKYMTKNVEKIEYSGSTSSTSSKVDEEREVDKILAKGSSVWGWYTFENIKSRKNAQLVWTENLKLWFTHDRGNFQESQRCIVGIKNKNK